MEYTLDELRERCKASGWTLHERAIRTGGPQSGNVRMWKITAAKGEKTVAVEGTTLDQALKAITATLGLIARSR